MIMIYQFYATINDETVTVALIDFTKYFYMIFSNFPFIKKKRKRDHSTIRAGRFDNI